MEGEMTAELKLIQGSAVPTWADLKREYWNMVRSGRRTVEEAVKVGNILLKLKKDNDFGLFQQRAAEIGIAQRTSSDLMRIAANWPKLIPKEPDSIRSALSLIPKKKRKVRRVVYDEVEDGENEEELIPTEKEYNDAYWMRVSAAIDFAKFGYPGKAVDEKMVAEARACAAIWNELANKLETRL
jgi:hypothetical protein